MIILHYAIEMDSFNDFRNQKYSLFSSFSDHMSDFLVKFFIIVGLAHFYVCSQKRGILLFLRVWKK